MRIAAAPSLNSGVITGTLATSISYSAEVMHSGFHCFDWKGQEEKQQDQRPAKKFHKKISKQQREEAKGRKERVYGAIC
jgi:hypothetical protein